MIKFNIPINFAAHNILNASHSLAVLNQIVHKYNFHSTTIKTLYNSPVSVYHHNKKNVYRSSSLVSSTEHCTHGIQQMCVPDGFQSFCSHYKICIHFGLIHLYI